jgi:hypothetical protein
MAFTRLLEGIIGVYEVRFCSSRGRDPLVKELRLFVSKADGVASGFSSSQEAITSVIGLAPLKTVPEQMVRSCTQGSIQEV